eukprot:jgi/Chrzof1/14796/Cz09g16150.t1
MQSLTVPLHSAREMQPLTHHSTTSTVAALHHWPTAGNRCSHMMQKHNASWRCHILCTHAYLIVPGADASGLVAPIIVLPYFTTSFPSQTMAITGPEDRKFTSLGKNGLPSCSA